MKVILLKDVKGLGLKGQTKDVAEGYARNLLLPGKMVEIATSANIQKLAMEKVKQEKEANSDLLETEKLADKLNGLGIEINGKANEEGVLYASITQSKISGKLKELGLVVKKEQIFLPEHIKTVGEHNVKINLDHGLEAEITVLISD